jgi:hypothetical protein
MLAFLTRAARAAAPARPRSFRPQLELLEQRECLSTLTLSYHFVSQNNASFDGQYSGASNVGGQTVTISGQAGLSTTATTDTTGHYHSMMAVLLSQFGPVTASVPDPSCNQAQVNVSALPPTIVGFSVKVLADGEMELSGSVTGTPDPQGMTITFGGNKRLAGVTATVAADGTFDIILPFTVTGMITATTTDWWGRSSGTAQGWIGSNAGGT